MTMGYLARKPLTLAGVEYRAGDPLPAEAVEHPSGLGPVRMEGLGLLRTVPDDAGNADAAAELRRERDEAYARIEELDNELAETREALEAALEAATAPTPDSAAGAAGGGSGEPGGPSEESGDDRQPITKPVDPDAPAPTPEPPPQGGAGSEISAWRDYAARVGVTVPDGATRGDIIDAIEAAGLPT